MKIINYFEGIDVSFLEPLLNRLDQDRFWKSTGNVFKTDSLVVFGGGTDISTRFYGESPNPKNQKPDIKRDLMEERCFKQAVEYGVPILGICRGSQLLTALNGGSLAQHITGHGTDHIVKTHDGKEFMVTSTHHQMMWPWTSKEPFMILAEAKNRRSKVYENTGPKDLLGIPSCEPEIVWWPKTRSLCVQGHPEYMYFDEPFPVYVRELIKKLCFVADSY